jgi:hypothetical protein
VKRREGDSLSQSLVVMNLNLEASMHHDNRLLTEKQRQCVAACTSCAQICETCSDDMIGMGNHDDHDLMVQCIRLCRDCADICMLTAQWLCRVSSWSEELCQFCADVCEQCAHTCEQHASQHPLCGQCAEECRRCAALCQEMTNAPAR